MYWEKEFTVLQGFPERVKESNLPSNTGISAQTDLTLIP
jgi:hypothetical protein